MHAYRLRLSYFRHFRTIDNQVTRVRWGTIFPQIIRGWQRLNYTDRIYYFLLSLRRQGY